METQKLNINWKLLISYITILVLITVLLSKCKNEKLQLATIKGFTSVNTTYVLKNGQLVVSNKTLSAVNKKQAIELIGKSKSIDQLTAQFSKVKTIISYKTKLQIDSIPVPYKDSIPCVFEKTGRVFDENYSFDYESNQQGFKVKNIILPDSVALVSGIKRKWFWGKETHVIDITHSNSLIKTEGLQSVEITPKVKFWNTTVFKIGIGVVAGALLVK
jgi:hypothetical protein